MDMEPEPRCGREHDFVLVLSGIDGIGTEVMNALFEAGCDDATPCLRFGRVYLTFSREAPSFKEAVLSAIRNVQAAGIGANVLCVDACDLVTQSDIARRIGRTRQLVGQYVSGKRGPGNFPRPVCDIAEGHPLWMWCEVSYWLWQSSIVDESVVNQSREVALINSVLSVAYSRHWDPSLADEVSRLADHALPSGV